MLTWLGTVCPDVLSRAVDMFRHFERGEESVRICLPSVRSKSTLRALSKLQRPKSGSHIAVQLSA